jgi:hypothetical protein
MPCIPLELIIIIVVFGGVISFITREPKKSGNTTLKREEYRVDVNIMTVAKPLFPNLRGLSTNGESVLESLGSFRESEDRMKEKEGIDRKDGGD